MNKSYWESRLLKNRLIDPISDCWHWTRSKTVDGYGIITGFPGTNLVHRVAHLVWIGPIPPGWTIDHVEWVGCVYRDCFNPQHLEAVTRAENVTRNSLPKGHCPLGHAFIENSCGSGCEIQPAVERNYLPRIQGTVEERLVARRIIDPDTDCWKWPGSVTAGGYGQIGMGNRKPGLVHRVAYELWVGPIPEGLSIDHVYEQGCRYRNCFNPEHLEAVTRAENSRRITHRAKTHCRSGHSKIEFGHYEWMSQGKKFKMCKECTRLRNAKRREGAKALRAVD